MEEYSIDDCENVLCLKNQLVCVDTSKLLEVYADDENYITFLDTLVVLLETDSAFLFLNEQMIPKIFDIINSCRFRMKDSEVIQVTNAIIRELNHLRCASDEYKQALKDAYYQYQQESRKLFLSNDEELLESIAYDAVVCAGLEEDHLDYVTDDMLFLASLNYLLSTMPELFQKDLASKLTIQKIDELLHKNRLFHHNVRDYAKETKKIYQKIQEK